MAEEEKNTASSKLTNFLEKNRKGVIAFFVIVIVAVIALVVVDAYSSSAAQKGITAIDEISYEMTNGSASLEDDELDARRDAALESLAQYTKKSGITGVRANMLCAEICFQQEKYEDALNYWKATAAKGKKSYTAPLANYNIAACYEELGNLDEAANAYKLAAEAKDFALGTHAKFSYGRVLETKGDYAQAMSVYSELYGAKPDDTWAQLAKTRMITLQVEGKAE